MAKFDLGGAVSTHNLLAACNNNSAANNSTAVGSNVHNTKTTQAVTAGEVTNSFLADMYTYYVGSRVLS